MEEMVESGTWKTSELKPLARFEVNCGWVLGKGIPRRKNNMSKETKLKEAYENRAHGHLWKEEKWEWYRVMS